MLLCHKSMCIGWNEIFSMTLHNLSIYNDQIKSKLLLKINWKFLFSISPYFRGWILLTWLTINSIRIFHFHGHFVHIKKRWQGKTFYYGRVTHSLNEFQVIWQNITSWCVIKTMFCQLMIYQLISYVLHQYVENKEIKTIWLISGFVIQMLVSLLLISGNSTKKALPRHIKWL